MASGGLSRHLSVSNSLSGRHWELDQVPAVGDLTDIVQLGTGHHVSAGEGQRRVALQRRVAAYLVGGGQTPRNVASILDSARELGIRDAHVLGQIRRRHRAIEFRAFLTALDVQVPADLDVHVIMDNYGTHKTALIRRWFARHPRFHPHFTPTYASWLNLVERWFAALKTKQLRRGVHDSVRSLESAIREFIDASNTVGQPYVWTKTADDILASIARFALRTVTVHDRQQVMSRTTGTGL